MRALRKIVRDAFAFSGNEINGFLILLPLVILVVVSRPACHHWLVARGPDPPMVYIPDTVTAWLAEVPVPPRDELSPFDPNTAPVATMIRIGIPRHLANRIAAYRQKGGRFRVKSDLLNIYGLDSALYKQLFLQIQLPSGREAPTARRSGASRTVTAPRRLREKFDLNTADTLLFKSVYGIGPTLAGRIVRFREALGGFVHPGQLYEVYGLDSVVVRALLEVSFIASEFVPEKVDINQAGEYALARHPYISRKMARRLSAYRFQHGPFTDAAEIRKLAEVDSAEVARILPYITAGD